MKSKILTLPLLAIVKSNQKVLFKVGTFYNNQHKLSRAFQTDSGCICNCILHFYMLTSKLSEILVLIIYKTLLFLLMG